MKIVQAIFLSGHSAFYFDDQQAIKSGAIRDGFVYDGHPQTQGYDRIRQPGECISILLELENGQYAQGDCVAVQYSGAGGRDPLLDAKRYVPFMENILAPLLVGRDVSCFVENARFFDEFMVEGERLHTAIRYGLSQALLDATAIASNQLKAEVISLEYGLPLELRRIPLFGQSGDDRYTAVDKMILRQVDALPHALINNIPDKLGYKGEKLIQYVQWLSQRIGELRTSLEYRPDLHIDVYGTVGLLFDHDVKKVAYYLARLAEYAQPFTLYIEGPVDAGGREQQVEELSLITRCLKRMGSGVKIVADEWCNTLEDIKLFADSACCDMVQIKTPDLGSIHNTVEAVGYCKQKNVQPYMGGTCNETDISARACAHVAIATQPDRLLAKPGMGFDEGLVIMSNELERSMAILRSRHEKARAFTSKSVMMEPKSKAGSAQFMADYY